MDRKHAAAMNYYAAAPGGLTPAGAMPMHGDKPGGPAGAGLYAASPAAFAHTSPYTGAPSGLGLAPQRSYPGAGMAQYPIASVPSPYSSSGFQPLSTSTFPAISQGGGFYTVPSVYQGPAVQALPSGSPAYAAGSQYATGSPYTAHAPTLAAPGNSPSPFPTPLPATQALYAATGYPGFSSAAPTRSYSQVAPLPYATAPQPSSATGYPGASTYGPPY